MSLIGIHFILLFLRKERNIMEAVSVGAMGAVKLVANVVVNLVAFVAILAFIDATLSYFGSRVGHPEVSFDASILEQLIGAITLEKFCIRKNKMVHMI